MSRYAGSRHFSLNPRFDMLYDGKLLFTDEEYRAMKSADEERSAGVIQNVAARLLALTGEGALQTEGMPPGEALRNALDIYENKVSLSREQLINRWKSPSVAADSILVRDGKLLLVRRGNEPYRGCYALPGGIVDEWETLEQCALRELMEETGIRGSIRGILGVYSDPDRDPRVRMISAAYVIDYIEGEPRAGDDASAALFFPLSDLPGLAFDHDRVVEEFRRSRYFRPQD